MRLITAICITAIVVAFAVPALAETQNVKISGDIGIAYIYQNDIDLTGRGGGAAAHAAAGGNENDSDNFFIQQVGLNIGADLTDNVSTYVRVISERDWDASAEDAEGFDVSLDEAYVTLKEMLYAPLTLKLGRQNIWLGKGFVVGNAGALVWDTATNLPMEVDEFSDMTAFDALRATLDYDPWTVDFIYSKIQSAGSTDKINDDVDLYTINVGYDFTKYDAEAEFYYVLKHDKTGRGAAAGATYQANVINTLGVRGSLVPFDNLNIWAEGAGQFSGKYRTTTRSDKRQAWAIDLGGEYNFVDVKWTPKLGAEYVLWSGEEAGSSAGKWNAWDPIYPGKFDTYYAAFRNITKLTDFDGSAVDATGNNNGATNEQQLALFGTINPMTDVKINGRYTYLTYDEVPTAGRSDKIGQELDGKIVYDYTEDVELSLAGGFFIAGQYFPTDQDDNAAQITTAVKVDF